MVVRTLLKLWLLVREWNKGDNSNLVSVVVYLAQVSIQLRYVDI